MKIALLSLKSVIAGVYDVRAIYVALQTVPSHHCKFVD